MPRDLGGGCEFGVPRLREIRKECEGDLGLCSSVVAGAPGFPFYRAKPLFKFFLSMYLINYARNI